MPPAGFEPVIPAGDRPHTLALDRSATRIGNQNIHEIWILNFIFICDLLLTTLYITVLL